MRDHDELGLLLELAQQTDEPRDIGVIERSIHLVEQAEGARLGEIDGEEQ